MKNPIFNMGLLLVGALFISANIEAQEPAPLVQFNNGEIADATAVNNNFSNHEQRIQALEQYQGCSAAQDGSSIVITCADGSSGVLASAGSVILLEGLVGEVPDTSTLVTGPWYVVDASSVVLGEFISSWSTSTEIADDEILRIRVSGIVLSVRPEPPSSIKVSTQSNSTELIYFAEADCQGTPFLLNTARVKHLMEVRPGEYAVATNTSKVTFEAASRRASGKFDGSISNPQYFEPTECQNFATIVAAVPMQAYFPPNEIVNATLPLRITTTP